MPLVKLDAVAVANSNSCGIDPHLDIGTFLGVSQPSHHSLCAFAIVVSVASSSLRPNGLCIWCCCGLLLLNLSASLWTILSCSNLDWTTASPYHCCSFCWYLSHCGVLTAAAIESSIFVAAVKLVFAAGENFLLWHAIHMPPPCTKKHILSGCAVCRRPTILNSSGDRHRWQPQGQASLCRGGPTAAGCRDASTRLILCRG